MSAAARALLLASALASLAGAKPAAKPTAKQLGFLDQGARVACRQGAPVDLLQHFPARLELLCVRCACPDGFVACQYAPNCNPPSRARWRASTSPSKPTSTSSSTSTPASTNSAGRQIRIGSTHFFTSGQPEAARSDHERLAAEALGLDRAQFEAKLVHFKRRLEARAAAAQTAQTAQTAKTAKTTSSGYLTGQINLLSAWHEDQQLPQGQLGALHLSAAVWEPAQRRAAPAARPPGSSAAFYLLLAAELSLIALVLTLSLRAKLGQLREHQRDQQRDWLWIQNNGHSSSSLAPSLAA